MMLKKMNYLNYSTLTTVRILLVSGLMGLCLVFPACECCENDPEPPPSNIYEQDPNAPPMTGGLSVYVFGGARYQSISQVDVSVYNTYQDYEKDIPLLRGFTDRRGRIDMGYLNVGNYYIYASKFEQGKDFQQLEALQIQDGMNLTRNIILY